MPSRRALRLRGEESGQRAEPVLAAAVGRIRWAWSHLVFAVAGPVVLLLLVGLTTGLVYGAHTGDMGKRLRQLLGAALVQPLTSVAAGRDRGRAVPAWCRGWRAAAWGPLVAFLVLTELGSVLNLSRWVTDHISRSATCRSCRAGRSPATPLLWLTCASRWP